MRQTINTHAWNNNYPVNFEIKTAIIYVRTESVI